MKRIAIVCESVTGNTAMLAEMIRSRLQMPDVPVLIPGQTDMDAYDVFFVGSWTDKGDCAVETAAFLEKLQDKDIFLFATCGFGDSEVYFENIYKRMASHIKPGNRILGHFVCQGKMPAIVLQRFEIMKNANPDCERWDECIANYHKALTHPDGLDLRTLCKIAEQAFEDIDPEISGRFAEPQ